MGSKSKSKGSQDKQGYVCAGSPAGVVYRPRLVPRGWVTVHLRGQQPLRIRREEVGLVCRARRRRGERGVRIDLMDGKVSLWYLGEQRGKLLDALFADGGHVELGSASEPARLEVDGDVGVLDQGRRLREAQYQTYLRQQKQEARNAERE